MLWDDGAPLFRDRREAGERLAAELEDLRGRLGVVLGVPRGGVVVAAPVARRLGWPLDVVLARKVGAPFNPELAAGAVAPDGVCRWNHEVLQYLFGSGISEEQAEQLLAPYVEEARQEVARRLALYRGRRAPLRLTGRTAVVVDDGVATGLTMAAALDWLARQDPEELVLASPVASPEALEYLRPLCDRIVCLATPEPFFAVGQYYADFRQVTDQEVQELLRAHGLPGDRPEGGRAGLDTAGESPPPDPG